MDYVSFTCPEGYVFEGTNNMTHYAMCHNWEYIYLFDPRVMCTRKYIKHFYQICQTISIHFVTVKLLNAHLFHILKKDQLENVFGTKKLINLFMKQLLSILVQKGMFLKYTKKV
jgi:hypothetical protein